MHLRKKFNAVHKCLEVSLQFVDTALAGNLAVSKSEPALLNLIISAPLDITTIPVSLNFVLKHS